MVGVTGFEPAASTSQTSRATNCATPRYVFQLWSCKWSNMWSRTNLTAFLIFINCPKSAPLKGFQRFSLSDDKHLLYAPKPPALPAPLHPDIQFKSSAVCGHSCGQSRFFARFGVPVKSRKRPCRRAFRAFAAPIMDSACRTPKASALPN